MALEDLLKNENTKNVAAGVAAAAVTYVLMPTLGKIRGPLGRAAYKAGVVLYTKARETMAEMREIAEDFVAEARSELRRAGEEVAAERVAEAGKETAKDIAAESK
jgi:hypothetical protein